MSKKTILIMDVTVSIIWLFTGVSTLLSDEISKISYGGCLIVMLLSLVLKTINDCRINDLCESNHKWFKMYTKLLNQHIELLAKTDAKEDFDNDD